MKVSDKQYVLLTGGLGNQLFQYSFLLSSAKKVKFLVTLWGKPRLNNLDQPEMASFILDDNCSILKPKLDNKITRKSIGYMLRSGYAPKKWEKKGIKIVAKIASSILVSIGLNKIAVTSAHQTLGYLNSGTTHLPNFHIGYFQSYKWASEPKVLQKLLKLRLKNEQKIEWLKLDSEKERPVVLHFRFGDYLAEEKFGIPSQIYYKNAVELISSHSSTPRNYWIFSDDIAKAHEIAGIVGIENPRLFTADLYSPSETLEIMRLGSDFIIANSTFSWWAAFLRHKREGLIVAPTPWFKGMTEPQDLIPPDWIQIPAHF